MPHVFQTSIGLRFGDIGVMGMTDYTTWSVIDANDTIAEEGRDGSTRCNVPGETSTCLLEIPRNLHNTFSARGRLDYHVLETTVLSLSAGYDPSAVDNEYLDPALYDANKWQIGLGGRHVVNDWLELYLSYLYEIWPDQTVTESVHRPTANGTYTDSRGWLNLSFDANF